MPPLHPAPDVAFRPLREEDLPRLCEWLRRPHLQRWWRQGSVDLAEIRDEYLPPIAGADDAHPFLALIAEEPVGYIQWYDACLGPDWWPADPPPGVRGIDQFLAAEDRLGQGWGRAMIGAFLQRLWADPTVTEVWVDPRPDNARAIACYRALGFRPRGEITTPDGPALWMTRSRPGSAASE